MLTSKERAGLKSLANPMKAIFNIGKEGVTPNLTQSIDDALEARELIKAGVLETSPVTALEAAETIAGRTHSEVVAVIGRKFILYRKSKKTPKIL